jgi:hypothetical protein
MPACLLMAFVKSNDMDKEICDDKIKEITLISCQETFLENVDIINLCTVVRMLT